MVLDMHSVFTVYSGGDRWGLGRDKPFLISDIQQCVQQWNLGNLYMAEGKVMLKYGGLKGKARNLQQTMWGVFEKE